MDNDGSIHSIMEISELSERSIREETGFDGIPTLPKEAEGTVKAAKELERWIVFEEDE